MTDRDFSGRFPTTRLRRTRQAQWIRQLVAESHINPQDLVQAVILREDDAPSGPITAMDGILRSSVDEAVEMAKRAAAVGVPALALFPYTSVEDRDATGSGALSSDNLMARAARAIKKAVPEIGLIGDVALDPYTDHGHDGLLRDGVILNDETVALLCQQAVVLAEAGFDVVAPSDMMDGRIGAIRMALDKAGYQDRLILSYAVKYASRFYGPYRDAIGSRGVLQGDKRTYQMDPRNSAEGLREAAMDVQEGADMLMVKPGLPYLDLVRRVKDAFAVPVAAFQVSGEYAMLRCAAEAGAFDFEAAALEALHCFRRAGADMIISYYAIDAAGWIARDL
ncbi:porphobilinogen synthase [Parvularcula sp. LCG005]|uniref:porphobilinogen synthase n=1 Tax=Parvularcula sp. LCG005 TaxID=3078805 RepID=UPI0029433473|nr:porphobilinogen synthase [Parvularcula sp. LCG005]WOI52377.1 porphobilinogen synthase [Parvularcula sp. LCG005]